MNRILSAGAAGLLAALALAVPATAAPVTIRVEGPAGALVPPTTVDPAAVGTLTRDGGQCAGTDTAAGALELGTAGDWDGTFFGDDLGVFVNRIKTVDYSGGFERTWGLYVNGESAQNGACSQPVQSGDDVLFAAVCGSATTDCFTGGVLDGQAPLTARPGEPFAVSVTQTSTTYGPAPDYAAETTTGAAPDATVSGGVAPATTDANGIAQVTVTQRGLARLRVTRAQQVPDTVLVCVTDGADGFCGTRAPDGTTLPPEVGGAPATPAPGAAAPAATPDTSPPWARIAGIREGRRFTRAKAPRRLRATVSDPSGVLQVKLALTRQVGKRCWWFSGSRERFVRSRCGKRPRFKLPGTGDVDYLLPKRLGKGRYVFDALATDRAGNRDRPARGSTRVVFRVR